MEQLRSQGKRAERFKRQKNCKMEQILLIGNGLNNLENSDVSWENSLKKLIDEDKHSVFLKDGKIISSIAYPFLFDLFADKKNDFFNEVEKIPIPEFAEDFVNKYNTILTTNFSREFEYSLGKDAWLSDSVKNETKYNLFRKKINNSSNRKTLWYIHGCIEKNSSVMMGQNHYVEQTSKIVSYLNGKYKLKETDNVPIEKIEDRVSNILKPISWVDYFFMDNVQIDIVGFGFNFAETDLWYLLKRRKELRISEKLNNRIFFYCLDEDSDSVRIRDASLKINEVDVKKYKINSNKPYKELYRRILNSVY